MYGKLNDYIKFRNSWMGFAILWVISFHLGNNLIPIFEYFTEIGYGGVDIFFFASGIGCYFSLKKNPDILIFVKKRIKRIFPKYIPIIIVFIIFCLIFNKKISIGEIMGNILIFGSLLGMDNQFNWYLGGLWIFYFLVPYIYSFIRNTNKQLHFLIMFIFILLFSLISINYENYVVIFSRFPIAFLGVLFGYFADKESKYSELLFIFLMFIGFILLGLNYTLFYDYLWNWGLYWYPFILITPGLCLLINIICHKIPFLNRFLDYIGSLSFELYLFHILLFFMVDYLGNTYDIILYNRKIIKILIVPICIIFSILYNKIFCLNNYNHNKFIKLLDKKNRLQ